MKITLAKSAGFCFGVKRAVDTVYEQLEMSAAEKQPIYTFGRHRTETNLHSGSDHPQ